MMLWRIHNFSSAWHQNLHDFLSFCIWFDYIEPWMVPYGYQDGCGQRFFPQRLMSEYNSSETFWSEHHSSETFLSLFPFGQRSFLSEYSTKINHMSANREEGDGNLWPKNLWWRWTSDESVTLTKDASDQKVYDKGFSDERVSDELAFHQRISDQMGHTTRKAW